jgi:SEC-C motif domain protein
MQTCPCGSQLDYKACCGKYHDGSSLPASAEALMRARYSAFATHQIKFIGDTHVPGTKDFDENEARNWAESSTWKKLEIVKTIQGVAPHKNGVVEFKAFYADKEGNDFCHHEIAKFENRDNRWFYVDGQIVGAGPITRLAPKVGRNDACPCGSGKKFKKCCGNT